ncbi:uncharacterized protein LOC134188459 [Corticium candelabrum]|uniref:uncharacterized protein LOC134188459 n=1 Tax=Corticium candelabrum TaxID=121492 RepID=UPI002E26523A|nr:uncharacterized protein LOC134188459 [Corticium candelabrum]
MSTSRLVCEGYLLKRRGPFQNRVRWFRLTTSEFQYFTTEEGDMIASFTLDKIIGVTEEGSAQFELVQREPFGASQRTTMLLEAQNGLERKKWVGYLKDLIGVNQGEYADDEELICEGCLTKVRGAGKKRRWFRLTNKAICYYTENGGKLMATLELDRIDAVKSQDNETFIVHGSYNFSASGKPNMTLRCPYDAIKRKWMQGFKRLQEDGLIKVKY